MNTKNPRLKGRPKPPTKVPKPVPNTQNMSKSSKSPSKTPNPQNSKTNPESPSYLSKAGALFSSPDSQTHQDSNPFQSILSHLNSCTEYLDNEEIKPEIYRQKYTKISTQVKNIREMYENQKSEIQRLQNTRQKLEDIINQRDEKGSDQKDGEFPEDHLVKVMTQLEQAHLKNAELAYETSVLRQSLSQQSMLLTSPELSSTILKIDSFLNSLGNTALYRSFSGQPSIRKFLTQLQQDLSSNLTVQEDQSLQRSTLLEQNEKQNNDTDTSEAKVKELKEEIKILTADRIHRESYLKAYSERITSLSKVVLNYKAQFKMLFTKFNQLRATKLEIEKDNDESFDQYRASFSEFDFNIDKPKEEMSIETLSELVTMKNVLLKTQQEELDKIKAEIVRGNGVYVYMSRAE